MRRGGSPVKKQEQAITPDNPANDCKPDTDGKDSGLTSAEAELHGKNPANAAHDASNPDKASYPIKAAWLFIIEPKHSNALVAIFTILIFLSGTAYTIFAALQWQAMKDQRAVMESQLFAMSLGVSQTQHIIGQAIEQTRAAQNNALAAESAAHTADATLRMDQRAWINIIPADITWVQDGAPVSCAIQVVNVGKTPAKHFDMNIRISILPSGTDPDFLYTPGHHRTHLAGNAILPNVPQSHTIQTLDDSHPPKTLIVTTVQREQVNRGELIFYIYGKATYSDVFGTPHWFTFCKYSGGLPGTPIPPGKPSKKCSAYNDTDSN